MVRCRPLSFMEAAPLIGLSSADRLAKYYNDAYYVCGDGVCVAVARHLAVHLLAPLLGAGRTAEPIAAE
jgi:DNA (cytosine-5)-methyltransferase 1